MQTKVTFTLALGFIMGLGLASCAGTDSRRDVASEPTSGYAANGERRDDKRACENGEVRNANGDCERPYSFDRPFRRGGR